MEGSGIYLIIDVQGKNNSKEASGWVFAMF